MLSTLLNIKKITLHNKNSSSIAPAVSTPSCNQNQQNKKLPKKQKSTRRKNTFMTFGEDFMQMSDNDGKLLPIKYIWTVLDKKSAKSAPQIFDGYQKPRKRMTKGKHEKYCTFCQ